MNNIKKLHALLTALLMINCAIPIPATEILSWEDCVNELIRNNPALSAAREAPEKANHEVSAKYAPFLPQISAGGSIGKSNTELDTGYQDSTSYQASLTANQNLFAGFGDLAALRRSQALRDVALSNLQATKASLSAALRQAFAQLLFAQENLQLSAMIAARRQENVNLVEIRFEAGRENKGSFLRSKAYHRQAVFATTQSQRNLQVARRQICTLLGRHANSAISVAGQWFDESMPINPDFSALMEQTPEYRAALAQKKAANEGLLIANRRFYPTWSANAMIGRSDDDSLIPKNDQWSLGTTLSFPLFSGGEDWFTRRAAQSDQRAAEAALADTRNNILTRLEERLAAWQDANDNWDVQKEFLYAAEVRAGIARAQYQNGLLSFEDWDLIENDLIDKQKATLASQRDARIAFANWEKALGTGAIP